MTTREALDIFFQSVIGQIRTDQGAKGITASGRSSDSLAYGTDATGGQLTGSNYFYWQIVTGSWWTISVSSWQKPFCKTIA